MIKNALKTQMDQTWRMLEAQVETFDDDAWLTEGCGYVTPARVALHTVLGVGYYIGHSSELGRRFGDSWSTVEPDELPSREQLLTHSAEVKQAFDVWLRTLTLEAENDAFPWCGPTQFGVLLFLVRHTLYHIGELNALLYRNRGGEVDDMWMEGFKA